MCAAATEIVSELAELDELADIEADVSAIRIAAAVLLLTAATVAKTGLIRPTEALADEEAATVAAAILILCPETLTTEIWLAVAETCWTRIPAEPEPEDAVMVAATSS
jgi:hypothetical protein